MVNFNRPIDNADKSSTVNRSDDTKPKKPVDDSYRKLERQKEKPPTKEETEQMGVEEKEEPQSLFDLSKTKPKQPKSAVNIKGQQVVSGPMEKKELPSPMLKEPSPKMGEEKIGPEMDQGGGIEMEAGELPEEQVSTPTEKPVVKKTTEEAEAANLKQSIEKLTPQQMAAARVAPKEVDKSEGFETKKESSVSKQDKTKGEAKTGAAESAVAQGITAQQTAVQATAFSTEKMDAEKTNQAKTIADLANQIVDRIQVMRDKDLTSTIVTLRHPPVLAGATVTITTSDTAKKECSISFANLTPGAKDFLDRQLQASSLSDNLEKKGIVVHNITTTTEPEKIITADPGQASQDRRDQQQDERQQQQRKQQDQTPGEEDIA